MNLPEADRQDVGSETLATVVSQAKRKSLIIKGERFYLVPAGPAYALEKDILDKAIKESEDASEFFKIPTDIPIRGYYKKDSAGVKIVGCIHASVRKELAFQKNNATTTITDMLLSVGNILLEELAGRIPGELPTSCVVGDSTFRFDWKILSAPRSELKALTDFPRDQIAQRGIGFLIITTDAVTVATSDVAVA